MEHASFHSDQDCLFRLDVALITAIPDRSKLYGNDRRKFILELSCDRISIYLKGAM